MACSDFSWSTPFLVLISKTKIISNAWKYPEKYFQCVSNEDVNCLLVLLVQLQTLLVASIIGGQSEVSTKKSAVSAWNITLCGKNLGILIQDQLKFCTLWLKMVTKMYLLPCITDSVNSWNNSLGTAVLEHWVMWVKSVLSSGRTWVQEIFCV